jgi:Zn-dependent oligopeptidase
MNLKTDIYTALQNINFPDLQFLYSSSVLALAPEILGELLEKEKADFFEKLEIQDRNISFETFEDFSLLSYFFGLLEHYQWVNNDEGIRKIVEDFEPKYIDFGNEVAYSKRYYDMIVYCLENTELDPEQERILSLTREEYEIRGIALSAEKQELLKENNQTLSRLTQTFWNNVLDSQKEFSYLIADESIIADMPEDDRKVAQKKAEEREETWFLFDASGSSYSSIMKYCSDSEIRKYFFDARQSFATEDARDNKKVILDILSERQNKSHILGFQNYLELSLHFKMAESGKQIEELFEKITHKAKTKAQGEVREIQEYFVLPEMQPWDLSYYARKLREQKYALDDKELKKYFELESVLSGMFEIIEKLYWLEMRRIQEASYDSEIRIFDVYKDDVFLSYFFLDLFYRPLKRHGAWANIVRENFHDKKKIVVNVSNFQKGSDGVTFLTLWDVETLFHEFGHATHEMMSRSPHSELSGFNVEWDFVELPSQLLENWCRHPDGLVLFAKHYQTGVKMPQSMVDTLQKLETFGVGNMILKQNEYSSLDLLLHGWEIPKTETELQNIVEWNYDACSLFQRGNIYNPHTSFTHIFDGGYAAGYYSYMWAEIIEKEVWKAFLDSGDIFSPTVSKRLYDAILSAGSTKKASELFRDFMGREVQIDAFLSEKGLV